MKLCDVTLREGDQMPGRSYTAEQKIGAGRALDRLGVEFIQAGFPATGEKDRRVVDELAATADARIVALSRAVPGDVNASLAANADVVEVFGPMSDLHLEHALGKSREEMLAMLAEGVDRARDGGAAVHVSLVDAFRTDPEHLVRVAERFPDAEFINLADTVGARTPASVREFLRSLGEEVSLDRVGVHFHDDLGVATTNALAASEVGVAKVDVSVASLGERAGNPALEEVVSAGAVERDDTFGVDASELIPVCNEVLETLNEDVDPRKALLGREVTEHESGIHTAAMLAEPSVFEPFDPARFGGERRLVFGEGTGRSGARRLLERAGVDPTEGTVAAFLDVLADRGPMGTDEAVELAREAF